MASRIIFYPLFGMPLLAWGGIITLICFLTTAYIGYSITKSNIKFTFKHHVWMARIAITLGVIHGLAGLIFVLGL